LIHLLYDSRAASAGWIVQVLAVSTWLYVLETTNSTALLAVGKPNWVAVGSAAKLVGMVGCIPLGMMWFGFPGAVVGLAASEFLRYLASVTGARSIRLAGFFEDMRLSAFLALTAWLGLLTQRRVFDLVRGLSVGHPKIALVLTGIAIALVVSAGWALLFALRKKRAG
jgi:O-antigen/teichoic acid export membrane protein